MRWQQRMRIGIAVFGAAFLVVLYLAFRAPGPAGGPPAAGRATREDPEATAQSTSGELLNLVRDAENFRLEYDKLLTYPDGRQKLEGARIHVPNRGGRDFTVRARGAEVGAGQDRIQMQGAVQLESSDGLVAKTEAADYSQSEGILRAPGPASFTKGRMSGASLGMTYDKGRDAITMLDDASMAIEPEGPGDAPVRITSGSAYFARADHYVRYERDFTLVSGARTLSSALATAYLTDDGARVESLEMRGQSRITGVGEGAGALRAMDADDINLEFAGDGSTLAGATLASRRPGRASIELGADGGTRRVAGQWIDVRFSADGATINGLTVRESAVLTLPAAADEPPRTITAATLTAKAGAGASLDTARFADNVEYRESPAGGTPRIVRSRILDAVTAPGLGAMTDARFSGAVRFEEGQLRAASGQARYLVDRGRIDLDNVDDTTGLSPRVTDGQVAIDAGHIEITTDPRRISARQDVRSVMTPAGKDAAAAGGDVRRAGMLEPDQPVYAAAAALEYDSTARVAVYTAEAPAQARLWQGDTTIQADRLTVDDATGNLSGKGTVATTFMIDEKDAKTGQRDRTPSIGRADDFLYDDGTRKATYAGSAHVSGPQGDLEASRIELFLAAEANELQRLEAYTAISLRDATRVVSGDRLTYTAAEGRYLVVGSPVKIDADCRETTGRTLTFYKSTNNIVVEPNDEFRTQVTSIPNCVAPGRK
ncbi:MAG: LPS export ABC transporter periplasmic protein LptC [Vicinamibacterales bacterium]